MDKREKLAYEIQSYINSHKPEGFEAFEDFEVKEVKEDDYYKVSSKNEEFKDGEVIHVAFKIEEDTVSIYLGAYNIEFDREKATEILEEAGADVYLKGESGDNSCLMIFTTTFDEVAEDMPASATTLLDKTLEIASLIIYYCKCGDEIKLVRNNRES